MGNKVSFFYDDYNRNIRSEYYRPDSILEKKYHYTYTDFGELKNYRISGKEDVTLLSGSFEFDHFGRKDSETVTFYQDGTESFSKTHSYKYRKSDQKSEFISPEGRGYYFDYDQLGQLEKIRFQGNGVEQSFLYEDYAHGVAKKITYPDGAIEDRDYDHYMRIVKADLTLEGGTTQRSYEWDTVDRIQKDNRSGDERTYQYDGLDRLVSVTDQEETSPREAYGYKSNLFNEREFNWDIDFEYNSKHQLERKVKGEQETVYHYNLNGNLTEKITPDHTFTYGYDTLNQLSNIKKDGVVIAEYLYDPFGRRVEKKVGETVTRFVYSDEGLIGQYSENGSLLRGFVWKVGGLWGTNPLLQVTAEDVYVYHNDHRGAPESLNTLDGVKVWSEKRESFGQIISSVADVAQPLGLPGQYFDQESGLYYNFYRYYDPDTGRYITQDPIGFNGGISLYAYAAGNPVMNIDPDGRFIFSAAVVALVVVGMLITKDDVDTVRTAAGFTPLDTIADLGEAGYDAACMGVAHISGNQSAFDDAKKRLALDLAALSVPFVGAAMLKKLTPHIPTWKGAGPMPGTIGVNSKSKSTIALKNYYPKGGGIEFIFDTRSKTFVVGKDKYLTKANAAFSPHQRLAKSIGVKNHSEVVGGMFRRDSSGKILTEETSGHYGEFWTPERRIDYQKTMESYGIIVDHSAKYKK